MDTSVVVVSREGRSPDQGRLETSGVHLLERVNWIQLDVFGVGRWNPRLSPKHVWVLCRLIDIYIKKVGRGVSAVR